MRKLENEVVSFQMVDKIYTTGTIALNKFDLSIKEGEFVSFLGPSGCGKSTALRMVAGLGGPTAGKVEVFGKNPMEVIKSQMMWRMYSKKPIYCHGEQYSIM